MGREKKGGVKMNTTWDKTTTLSFIFTFLNWDHRWSEHSDVKRIKDKETESHANMWRG